jgi:hypothetical protein
MAAKNSKSMKRKPYFVGGIIKDSYHFYGRDLIIQDLVENQGKATCIIGVRRIGKSSLLYQVKNRYSLANSRISIYFSLEALTQQTMGQELHKEINSVLKIHHPKLPAFIVDNLNFEVIVETWIDYCLSNNVYTLLLLDEAERLIHLKIDALDRLRRLFTAASINFSVVITGSRKIRELPSIGQEFLSDFEEIILTPLDTYECRELITQRGGVVIEPYPLECIINYTTCHPFFTQFIANSAYKNGEISYIEPDHKKLPASQGILGIIAHEFSSLPTNEQKIMRNLDFGSPIDINRLKEKIGGQDQLLLAQLDELEKLSLIRSNKEQYYLSNIFWQKFIETQ